jgi:hypothetical protein
LLTLTQPAKTDTWVFVKPKPGLPTGKNEKPKSMKATLMPGFDPATTIEIEANILGYTFSTSKVSDEVEIAPKARKEEFTWGTLYTWSGIQAGASTYSYLCRKVEKSCVKVGPYEFPDYDWSTVEFRGAK